MLVSLIICFAIIVVDQITKFCFYGMSQSIIGDFLWFESTLNTGASFGMLEGGTVWFIVFSLPLVILMFFVICSKKYNFEKHFKIGVSIILGGTVGNLIDRIIFGGVRDFIYFKSINFAIFNVADIAITVGAIYLVIYSIIYIYRSSKEKNKQEQKISDEEAKKIDALKSIRDSLENNNPSSNGDSDTNEKTENEDKEETKL